MQPDDEVYVGHMLDEQDAVITFGSAWPVGADDVDDGVEQRRAFTALSSRQALAHDRPRGPSRRSRRIGLRR
jgi:hypothetical protein